MKSGGLGLVGFGLTMGLWFVAAVGRGETLTALHVFTGDDGRSPVGRLLQGRDGDFYGTTLGGPATNAGMVFKCSVDGLVTPLHVFTGGDGAAPYGNLIEGRDGLFHGATAAGGGANAGTVFAVASNGVLQTWYSFLGGMDGRAPNAGLAQGADGWLYGTTATGGLYSSGTVFTIASNGALTTLHAFTGGPDGGQPAAGLVRADDGNFYGTTSKGGASGYGTCFQLAPSGALTTLHAFTAADGGTPNAMLTLGLNGALFGTTESTVFRMATNGTLTLLYKFPIVGGIQSFYERPYGVVQGRDGYLYGTTTAGGAPRGGYSGMFYRLLPSGLLSSLISFNIWDASKPKTVIQGTDGAFYGTWEGGGVSDFGAVVRLSVADRWPGVVDLSDGWQWLDWFGCFSTAADPWILHREHGWLYCSAVTTSSMWLWSMDMGWVWTSDALYPSLYSASRRSWFWYQVPSANPRWFCYLDTGRWYSH